MRNKRFTFVCNDDEKGLLVALAEHYHRSQGDFIRLLIRQAACNKDDSPQTDKTVPNATKLMEVIYKTNS